MTNNCNIHSSATANFPTAPFTEQSMGKLLTAYKSLRDLEELLSLIAGIDPSKGLLHSLQHMDNLIQNLSPLYDRNLDYDKQIYTKILENDSLTIPVKAHILLGSPEENGISDKGLDLSNDELIMKRVAMAEDTMQRTSIFTVENMADLLTAYYGYFNLSEAIKLFAGVYPNHKILHGLSHLSDLLAHLSPLYSYEFDNDDIENAKYTDILYSCDMGLQEKAYLLMGKTLS